MTVDSAPQSERNFARDIMPWLVGAGALAVYLLTLNRWINLQNLPLVVRADGWDWQQMLSQPLLYLILQPFRLLPQVWVPPALNSFTAVCAALTLLNLARTVALLSHNRVEAQRRLVPDEAGLLTQRNAWVPVALAAAALGLQLSFWEHSIAASGEMFDLLLFAYIIRCLVEHRVGQEQFWLDRAALLFGICLANNWSMPAFLPFFVLAVLRTKRLSFFTLRTVRRIDRNGWNEVKPALRADVRFFVRMLLLGLAGCSLFLLLPLVQGLSPGSSTNVWQALRSAAISYEGTVHLLGRFFLRQRPELTLLLTAASLLPVFLLSIRWGALSSHEQPGEFDLPSVILHIAHAFLLVVCLGTMFDPPFSPRQIAQQNGLPVVFLPLYYLTAVSVGYFSGFFLLLFGASAVDRISRRYSSRRRFFAWVPFGVYAAAVLAVAGLLLINVGAIRAGKEPHLERFAKLAAEKLPPAGALLFSDDPGRLAVVMAGLAREGRARQYVPVDSRNLGQFAYRSWLSKQYPGRWPDPSMEPGAASAKGSAPAPLDPFALTRLVAGIARSNEVYWLQSNFGPLFEDFYLQPHGLLQEMKPYPPLGIGAPLLTAAQVTENQVFWQRATETAIQPVLQLASLSELPRPGWQQFLMKKAHLRTPLPPQIKVLAWWYSAALDRWGVTLQQNDQWTNAIPWLTLAKDLKPDNLAAAVSLACNSNYLGGQPLTLNRMASIDDLGAKYKSLNQLLADNGPADDPTYCFQLGRGLLLAGMRRQGLQQLERAKALVPDDVVARLLLADAYSVSGVPDQTLRVISEIRAEPKLQPLGKTNEIELAFLEARAYYGLTNRAKAEAIIYTLLGFNPGDEALRQQAIATFTAYQSYPAALRLLDRHLQQCSDDTTALMQKGNLHLIAADYTNAVSVYTWLLTLTNGYVPRLNRSLAYLRLKNYEAAEADCRELLKSFPEASRTLRGLGEIAEDKKDTNAAIRYYEEFLSKNETETDETRMIAARLRGLKQTQQ